MAGVKFENKKVFQPALNEGDVVPLEVEAYDLPLGTLCAVYGVWNNGQTLDVEAAGQVYRMPRRNFPDHPLSEKHLRRLLRKAEARLQSAKRTANKRVLDLNNHDAGKLMHMSDEERIAYLRALKKRQVLECERGQELSAKQRRNKERLAKRAARREALDVSKAQYRHDNALSDATRSKGSASLNEAQRRRRDLDNAEYGAALAAINTHGRMLTEEERKLRKQQREQSIEADHASYPSHAQLRKGHRS